MAETLAKGETLFQQVREISRDQVGDYLAPQNYEEPTDIHGIRYLGGGFKIERILRQPTLAYVPPGLLVETEPLRLVQFGGEVSGSTSRLVHESSIAVQMRERMNAYPRRQVPPWQPDRAEKLDPRIMADLPLASVRTMIIDKTTNPIEQDQANLGIFRLADRALVDEGTLVIVSGSLQDAKVLQKLGFTIKALQAPPEKKWDTIISPDESGWEIVAKKISPKYRGDFNAGEGAVNIVDLLTDLAIFFPYW